MGKFNFSNIIGKMTKVFVPQEETDARVTINGTVVVKTNTGDGKQWVDADATVYPEEMIVDFPVFTIAKTVDQVKVGDIVKLTGSTYASVTEIRDGKVETLSFGGQHRQAKAYKDAILGQATVRVVANPLGGGLDGTANNPLMMLALLDKEGGEKNDLVQIMMLSSMLSGTGANPFGNIATNPMAMMALMNHDGDAIQTMMLMQCMQNGGLNGFFGVPTAPVAPAAPAAPAQG